MLRHLLLFQYVGFVDFDKNNDMDVSQTNLFQYTDELLYKAKTTGRNKM